jgi:type IX secretion system PorP/SprF family membrane protein
MKKYPVYILAAIALLSGARVNAQADISMATHWSNRAYYNPAFIARTDFLYLFANARKQWMGVDGAPEVLNLQASQYFQSIRSAIGLSMVCDKIGVTRSYNPMMSYAFRMAKKDRWTFALGLSAGMFSRSVNGSLFEADNSLDPNLFNETRKYVRPDFNAGAEFQNNHFIIGISSTHLFSKSIVDTIMATTSHRYGYAIYKNDDLKQISYSAGLQVINKYNATILEGNFTLRIKHQPKKMSGTLFRGSQELLDVGVTCRTSRQLTVQLGLMLNSYLRIGYAYDQSLFRGYAQNQTHEIMLEYRIPAKAASPVVRCGGKEYWYH